VKIEGAKFDPEVSICAGVITIVKMIKKEIE